MRNAGFELNNKNHVVVIGGDLFDRGSQSVECYQFVKDMLAQNRLVYVRGNHEDLMFDCVRCLKTGRMGSHHVSNGTVKTLAQLMHISEYDLLCNVYDSETFINVTQDLLDFIDTNCVDYFEIGDKVVVHGWVPTTSDDNGYEIVHANWRDGDWKQARWTCGFDCWRCKLTPPDGQTVVCGHWHTSYGWSEFRGRSEWGPDAEFTSFIDDKIIAIDACTAYTKMVNVIVLDEEGNLQ